MKTHKVKSWPEFFDPVQSGLKPFELRKNDRDYQIGDTLWLQEFEPRSQSYTGREHAKIITYVLQGAGHVGAIEPLKGLHHGYCILGLSGSIPTENRQIPEESKQ